ncbi:MAG TPA: YIP1 family protein [Longimicrobiales bacterium]
MTTEVANEVPVKHSRWEDLVDVFFAPSELFARRANDSWLKPFLLLCVICVVLYYVFLPVNTLVMQAAMVENAPPNADLEKIQQGAAFMRYLGGVFVPIAFAFTIAVTAVGLKLVSSLLDPAAKWGEAFLIATFSMFVTIPQQVLGAVLVFSKSRSGSVSMSDVSFGVLRFMGKQDPVMRALLGRADLFAIWSAVLLAIGLITIVHMPRGKAILTAAIT